MTCRDVNDFLDAYVGHALDRGERARFDAHLGGCRHCRAFLDSYRRTIRLGRSLCEDQDGAPPAEVPEALIQSILAARPRAGHA